MKMLERFSLWAFDMIEYPLLIVIGVGFIVVVIWQIMLAVHPHAVR